MLPRLIVLPLLLLPALASAQDLTVEPYLQLATATSIHVMWETQGDGDALVQYGLTTDLGTDAIATSFAGELGRFHHRAELTGLTPATRYHYRVLTGSTVGDVHDFVTPAEATAEAPTRIVAMSDMQQDWLNPDKFAEVVDVGVIPFVEGEGTGDLPADVDAVVVPGDLVDNGLFYSEWADTFFAPGRNLFHHVPLYPVAGNHENDSPYYFDYFHLPDNGFEEHWYWHDLGNVRLVGLDSNGAYRTEEQLAWLDEALEEACDAAHVDFVFAQLHHPHKSELWLPGEVGWTGDVIARLEAFTTECGKPSLHFFGHTHGYSRGQSRDHQHLWVNVATAGGNIDYWGEYPQADYDEFVVSQDEWGFVFVEVEAGFDPKFRLRRVSRGNEDLARANEVRDDLTIRRDNEPPATPEALSPRSPNRADADGSALLVGSTYSDPEGDAHGASHWQVTGDCDGDGDWSADALLAERWLQHRNEYGGEDLQAGDDLSDAVVSGLPPGVGACWRVRYRDVGLAWSAWSEPAAFATRPGWLSDNLLTNPGAEDGIEGWTVTAGTLESLTAGECAGLEPHSGERYFVVGGLCADEAEIASAVQRVTLAPGASEAIDLGLGTAWFGGWFRDYDGTDLPEVEVIAYDDEDAELGTSGRLGQGSPQWVELTDRYPLPEGTRAVDFVLHGTRFGGTDNDSYLDDLSLRLGTLDFEGDDDDAVDDDDDDDTTVDADDDDDDDDDEGCGCRNGIAPAAPSYALTAVLLIAVLRRRVASSRTARPSAG